MATSLPATAASCPSAPTFSFNVPDPTGDAFPLFGIGPEIHDITSVSGEGDSSVFCLTVQFAGPVDPADAGTPQRVVGWIDFDTDANSATGFTSPEDSFCPSPAGLGVDAELDLFGVSGGFATLYPSGTPVSVVFDGTSFTAAIPLADLGSDPSFDLAMVLGTFSEPTDCAPNGGGTHSPDGSFVPFVPLQVSMAVDPRGTVEAPTGSVTVGGTITCSKPAFAYVSGNVQQKAGRLLIDGQFFSPLPCNGATRWTATLSGNNGVFKAGSANVSVAVSAYAGSEPAFTQASAAVRLTGSRPLSPPVRGPASPPVFADLGGLGSLASTAVVASAIALALAFGFFRLLRGDGKGNGLGSSDD